MTAYHTNYLLASTSVLLVPFVQWCEMLATETHALRNLGLRGWFEGDTSMATQYQEGLFRNEPCHTKYWEQEIQQCSCIFTYDDLSGKSMPVKPNRVSVGDVIDRNRSLLRAQNYACSENEIGTMTLFKIFIIRITHGVCRICVSDTCPEYTQQMWHLTISFIKRSKLK